MGHMRLTPAVLLLLCACTSEEEPEPVETEPHVLIIGWDGVRADAVTLAETPVLDTLAVDTTAHTQLTGPTVSAAGWMSVFTGVEPDKHGVTENGVYDDRATEWKTVAERVQDASAGPVVAAVHWVEILQPILGPDAIDDAGIGDDEGVTVWLEDTLADHEAHLAIAHFDAPDHEGHASGYSVDNADYMSAIEDCDAQLGRVLDTLRARASAAEESWLVIVTTDHGGEGTGHGEQTDPHQEIFVAMGALDGSTAFALEGTSHLDVTPTALDWLGVDHQGLDGVSRLP